MRNLTLTALLFLALVSRSQTWREFNPSTASWWDVKSSADGSVVLAGIHTGRLWLWRNSAWSEARPNGYDSNYIWKRVVVSGDGNKMMAAAEGRRLWYYDGSTWTEQNPPGGTATNRPWMVLALSNDGSTRIAGYYPGRLYLYSSGAWSEIRPGGYNGDRYWYQAQLTSDGSKHLVCYGTTGSGRVWWWDGSQYIERQPAGNAEKIWRGLDMSADGTVQAVAAYTGRAYKSTNSGANWTEIYPSGSAVNENWYAVSVSPNGTNMIATKYLGPVYTYNGTTWMANSPGGSSYTYYHNDAINGPYYFAPASGNKVYTSLPSLAIKAVNNVTTATLKKINSVSKSTIKKINGVSNN